MARFDLSDEEWALIKPLLPNKPRGVSVVPCSVSSSQRADRDVSECLGSRWPSDSKMT
jgi:transposase